MTNPATNPFQEAMQNLKKPLLPEVEKSRAINLQPMDAALWTSSSLSPPCIVENYLYKDIMIKIAAGGTGKTTIMIMEAICIATGIPLFGFKVMLLGPVVIFTAEACLTSALVGQN